MTELGPGSQRHGTLARSRAEQERVDGSALSAPSSVLQNTSHRPSNHFVSRGAKTNAKICVSVSKLGSRLETSSCPRRPRRPPGCGTWPGQCWLGGGVPQQDGLGPPALPLPEASAGLQRRPAWSGSGARVCRETPLPGSAPVPPWPQFKAQRTFKLRSCSTRPVTEHGFTARNSAPCCESLCSTRQATASPRRLEGSVGWGVGSGHSTGDATASPRHTRFLDGFGSGRPSSVGCRQTPA